MKSLSYFEPPKSDPYLGDVPTSPFSGKFVLPFSFDLVVLFSLSSSSNSDDTTLILSLIL